jgi:glycosyltransferase involved in cell wall biosynthesis
VSLADFINPDPNLYDEGLILYMGTIIRKKGVFELPDIINKVTSVHQNAKLVLIGADSADLMTGSTSTWKLIEDQFNDNAEYLGKVHYDEVKKYIQKAHICIFPTYAETLGMVTIETMAMQKPVVNSNFGWAQEIITDGVSGFLVHPADHDKFAERILQLLNDAELCRKIGVNARERVDERFNIQKNAAQNIQLYKRLKQ